MATKNIRIMRPLSYWGQVFSLAILFSFVIVEPSTAAEVEPLFKSSWDTETGTSNEAVFDGGKWFGGAGMAGVQQAPYVSAGGPGGHNYLNMVTVGGGGWGNPYYFNWDSTGGDILGDPDDIYFRFYFRVHQGWADGGSTHWFMGRNASGHYLNFADFVAEELAGNQTDFVIEIEKYSDGRFQANVSLQKEVWYCYELLVHKVDESKERWYIRLNGQDITDKYYGISGNVYGQWLNEWYESGGGFANTYHSSLYLTTYDQDSINDGWDVACIEVRDDHWPGLVDGGPPPTDTTPPTGSIGITGVEDRTDKTGATAVTLTLSATDTDSGMGSGAQMQFSNDGATWSSPEPYAQSKAWTLLDTAPGTEQSRTIHVKFKDVAGNWSNPISDSIILDRQPPSAPLW